MTDEARPRGLNPGQPRTVAGTPADADYEAERRRRLRRLDDCLDVLEAAHEAGLVDVNTKIAEMICERVPSVSIGMSIADAIEEVLRCQEPFMAPQPPRQDRRVRHRRAAFDARTLGLTR
jgi:hypothetical protein